MKYAKGNKVQKRKGLRLIISITITVVIVFGVGAIVTNYWYQQQLKPRTARSTSIIVDIPTGTSPSQIAKTLQQKGVIKSATAFEFYLRSHDLRESLKAGQYQLDSSKSVAQIVDTITLGKIKTNLFTILPGQRLDQIKASMIKAGFKTQDVDSAMDPANYKNHPALVAKPTEASLEGYLYPESFQTTAATTPKQIIELSLDQMSRALTPEMIDQFQTQGLGIHKAVTLASIVEKEVSKPVDRKMVAGVFLNRLKTNMALGSDVTYHYIAKITNQDPTPFIDSPYNTRKYPGLPPGPISNVSKSSLDSVANPTTSDYLFFVAGDDGITYFSKTAEEHDALAKEHCKKLCSTY
ncbi:MAG: endolytic transglycosylase MltG [Candidatus Saccharibacteria bacterium]